jgi:Stage II sporulation protein E (SpoIIE)
MSKPVLLFLLLWPLPAFAQSIVTVPPQQCVWRAGDNPAWAAPGLDESGWQPSSQWKIPVLEPHLWARCPADLGALRGTAHLAIQISLDGSYQLFVNGVLVGGAGDMRTGFISMNSIRQYPLSAASLQSKPDTIALRITFRFPIFSTSPLDIHAGDSEALTWQRASVIQTHNAATPLAEAVFFSVIGFMLLGLFYYDRSRRELLYLSIVCVIAAVMSAETFCSAMLMNFPAALHPGVEFPGNIVAPVVSVLFFFTLARRRVPRLYWVAVVVVVAQFTLLGFTMLLPADASLHMVGYILAVGRYTQLVVIAQLVISVAPFVAFWPYRQISRHMRPLAILCMLYGVANIFWFALGATATLLRLPSLFYTWQGGVAGANFFVRTCVLVALLGLLFRDQRRVTEERALLAGEMQAAGEIQRMLAPVKIETAPGLHIDVAFHPMRDVGGDFYSCRILPGNRQRILLGDVSGKGAAAAMTAAVLLGAAQKREDESPAALLQHLNGVLNDMRLGGFATCLCAELTANGTLTVANAGHLAPYRNGEELKLDSAFPLGIEAAAEYAETTLRLTPGETLTFLSDGVVEARNTAGELFGFERTREISNQSAEKIAAAAQRFGQEDDITVLTVASVAKLEAAVV